MAHAELDKVHRKGVAHLKSGGRKGAGLDDHVNKAKDRIGKSVDRIKNSAKSRIREVAGCDDEGEGFSTRGAGLYGRNKKGSGFRMRGAGVRKKKCTCH